APAQKKEVADESAISALIRQLGDDAFDKREQAQKKLAAIGEPALEMLSKAVKESTDVEVRTRGLAVLREIEHQRFRTMLVDKKWGELVDPDRDCAFRVEKGALHIKLPPAAHVLTTAIGLM